MNAPWTRRRFLRFSAAALLLGPRRLRAAECDARFVDHTDRGRLEVSGIVPYDLATLRTWITPTESFFVRSHFGTPFPRGGRLEIAGRVSKPGTWALEDLRRLPRREAVVTLECAGNSVAQAQGLVSTARFAGAALGDLLERVEVISEDDEVVSTGADRPFEHGERYARSITVREALGQGALLAWEMNGAPLTAEHGAPLRLIVPGWYGMASVKWLARIELTSGPFRGRFQTDWYTNPIRGAYGRVRKEPVTRIGLKSVVAAAERQGAGVRLRGAAWGGEGEVERVELTLDGGHSWSRTVLADETAPGAWRLWRYDWRPGRPGTYRIASRAFGRGGVAQPLERPERLVAAPYVRNEVVARLLAVDC